MMKSLSTLCIIFIIYGLYTSAFGQPSREYQIKAAFLYNFGRFVEWPADSFEDDNTPFTYCVIGQDPFGSSLNQALKGKSLGGRQMILERPREIVSIKSCHLLFVSSSEQQRVAKIFEPIRSSSVLTVGDMEGFASLGGIINLIKRGNKIRFEINTDAANRAGLKLSSSLLKLATIIKD